MSHRTYRVEATHLDGKALPVRQFMCENDGAAMVLATILARTYPTIRVWAEQRFVGQVVPTPPT